MLSSYKLYRKPFHPDHFCPIQSLHDLEKVLSQETREEHYILADDSKLTVSFEYFLKYHDPDFCFSLGFAENSGQLFYELENQRIISEEKGLHIHDGLVLGNLISFHRKKTGELIRLLDKKDYHGVKGIVCPMKVGKTKALFLDRDGVINIDKGYVYRPADLEFNPGIFDFLLHAQKLNFELHVLTNQSGVARGLYREEDVKKLHFMMNEEFKKAGVLIKTWSYCLFHDEALLHHYKLKSILRKPKAGMLLSLCQSYAFDFDQSLMIGDKLSDVLEFRGLRTVLLQGEYPLHSSPVKVCKSLEELSLIL